MRSMRMRRGRRLASRRARATRCGTIALVPLVAALASVALAADPASDIEALRKQLQSAAGELRRLRESLAEQERRLAADRAELERQRRALELLETQIESAHPRADLREPTPVPQLAAQAGRGPANEQAAQAADAGSAAQAPAPPAQAQAPAAAQAQPPQTVGQAPERPQTAPPEVAPIFEAPGVLTPKGKWVFEPSFEYAYSSSNRVSVIGFEIFPALLIGVLDIRTANRSTYTASLTTRYGLTKRLELELKVPYLWRDETLQTRDFLEPSFRDATFNTSGQGVGDIELAARYQFNQGDMEKPYYVGTLRLKTRTGKDQFEVLRDPDLPQGGGRFRELPTGTGFYGLRPEFTVIYPTDPVVFFGSVNYLWNIKRDDVSDRTGASFGDIDPGDAVGFNFGMGLALNERASFSIGYEHTIYGKTKVNGTAPESELTVQIGSLQMGYAYRLTSKTNLNLSLGIGATKDAPDVQINLRLPTMF
jgi:hypothetical protein